ncbi:class I SAM-dependent methyltransferase [Pseudonocardia nigra]|uniref:class I SAM-dependent methyltransferase n=1 Tax=Pseudonocardia nigra TaxID=1921578 RepID=UPI001C5DB89A|nr:methyltransferase domain-containing protein [Pseudonocardia nigra]
MTDGGEQEDGGAVAERLLRAATDARGNGPLGWAAEPLAGTDRVLDLVCGAGPLADELPAGRWIGVDPAPAAEGRAPRLRATPAALPLRHNAVDGIAVLLALPALPDLDGVFAELRRVLRPGGTLVVVVPSAVPRSVAELRLAPLLAPVHREWPHRSALDRVGWLLAAADFAVLGDDRVPFALPLPDAAAANALVADLPRAGIWPPGLPSAVRDRVAAGLARRAGPDRVLPVPLRRLVARR